MGYVSYKTAVPRPRFNIRDKFYFQCKDEMVFDVEWDILYLWGVILILKSQH